MKETINTLLKMQAQGMINYVSSPEYKKMVRTETIWEGITMLTMMSIVFGPIVYILI